MRLLPIQCSACHCFTLVDAISVNNEGCCECECGCIARALPGQSYGVEDLSLFDAVVTSIEAAEITWMNASRLVLELEACGSPRPMVKLARLKQLVPALSVIELIASSNPATARKAWGMFSTLLDAISRGRSRSGVMPALREAPAGELRVSGVRPVKP
jgi:hypothetical protein